jgi:hypothetical protein
MIQADNEPDPPMESFAGEMGSFRDGGMCKD